MLVRYTVMQFRFGLSRLKNTVEAINGDRTFRVKNAYGSIAESLKLQGLPDCLGRGRTIGSGHRHVLPP